MVSHTHSNLQGKWAVRGATLALWAAIAACAAYWWLNLSSGSPAVAIAPAARAVAPADPAAVARLLGSTPQAAAASAPAASLASRFSLVGVAARRPRGGAALIIVDGRPAKPFRVGSQIEEGLLLQSVEGRRAVLAASADGPAVLTLELPPLRQ